MKVCVSSNDTSLEKMSRNMNRIKGICIGLYKRQFIQNIPQNKQKIGMSHFEIDNTVCMLSMFELILSRRNIQHVRENRGGVAGRVSGKET